MRVAKKYVILSTIVMIVIMKIRCLNKESNDDSDCKYMG